MVDLTFGIDFLLYFLDRYEEHGKLLMVILGRPLIAPNYIICLIP